MGTRINSQEHSMNRITSTTRRRLTPRTTVIGGAALGLIAGATVYGAVTSSAQDTAPAAFKAPVPAAAKLANCTAGSTLANGVCVVHIAGTPGVPSPAATAAAKAAHLAASKRERSEAGDRKSDKDGDHVGRRAGSKSDRDGASNEGSRAGDGDDRAVSSTVRAAAPVPTRAPVRAPAPRLTSAPTAAPVASAAS
jgi:hypothetical protein